MAADATIINGSLMKKRCDQVWIIDYQSWRLMIANLKY